MSTKVATEQERQERRERDRQRSKEAVEALRTSEGWRRWLSVRRHFRSYSLANQLLIALQRPEATRVCGFRAWLRLGYCVRKGERAIRIWLKRAISHRMRVRVLAVSVRLGPVRTDGDVGGCGDSFGVCGEVCCGRLSACT